MPGWWAGANMKPKPRSSIDCAIRSGRSSRANPSDSSTSAEPAADEAARLPCFATPAPAAAATSAAAVEMFRVRAPSPPVPAVSTRSSRAGRTGTTCSRIASARPAISSAVSPFARRATRNPPICVGVASPRMISCITSRASARARLCPSSSRASEAWIIAAPGSCGREPGRRESAPTPGGIARRRSAAHGGERPSPRRPESSPSPRGHPGRGSRRASGTARR
jgi:hypothetical protein